MALHGDVMFEAVNARLAERYRAAEHGRLARMAGTADRAHAAPPEHGLVQRLRDLLARRYVAMRAMRPVRSARS